MDDLALLDEDGALSFRGGDVQHRRTARQAFHLQHVLQTDAPQHAAKPFLRLEFGEFLQRAEQALPALLGDGFFQEQFRAVAQARGAILLRRIAGQHDLQKVGILAIEQSEELQAVHDRHVDIDHQQFNFPLADQPQRAGRV